MPSGVEPAALTATTDFHSTPHTYPADAGDTTSPDPTHEQIGSTWWPRSTGSSPAADHTASSPLQVAAA